MSQTISFTPLKKSDFARVAGWLGEPHVAKWWHEPATVAHVAKEYGACTDGDFRTRVYIVRRGRSPIGMIQCYLTDSWPKDTAEWAVPNSVGIDYLIGRADLIGHGLGSTMIREFENQIIRPLYPDATNIISDPETANLASVGALAKAGFTPYKVIPKGEYGTPEQLMLKSLR
jgi:aminoglycoside 6'-N-acetyltransferase